MTLNFDRRKQRRARWLKLDPQIQGKIPSDYFSHMDAEIEKSARQEWAKERIIALDAERIHRLSPTAEKFCQGLVLLIGVLTLAGVPTLIAVQTNRGAIAISMGALGGGALGFFGHNSATEVLASIRLKQDYEKARNAIKKK